MKGEDGEHEDVHKTEDKNHHRRGMKGMRVRMLRSLP